MDSLNISNNHPNYIWYWLEGKRLWYLPYPSTPIRLKKGTWHFQGGVDVVVTLEKTTHILIYGSNEKTGDLPILFLSECAAFGVGLTVHNNHISEPLVLYRWQTKDRDDLLTKQIIARENSKTKAYIARTLVKWQLNKRMWLTSSKGLSKELAQCRSTEAVMLLEAQAAQHYWRVYYKELKLHDISKSKTHPVNSALDALSHFMSGMFLRWIIAHGFSPSHGYLHRQTSYASLVYDLMEPYRWWIEKVVFEEYQLGGEDDLVNRATERFKQFIEEPVNAEPTRQTVYRKTLIQGAVIALRYYLTGKMNHYLPPIDQEAKARGRKRNCAYKLPGQIWRE